MKLSVIILPLIEISIIKHFFCESLLFAPYKLSIVLAITWNKFSFPMESVIFPFSLIFLSFAVVDDTQPVL